MRAEHGALQWNQRAEKERERRRPAPHGQTAGVGRALETNDDIVGVAHDDHVAYGVARPPPLLAAGRSSDPFKCA
jgi:hypothetical protein